MKFKLLATEFLNETLFEACLGELNVLRWPPTNKIFK